MEFTNLGRTGPSVSAQCLGTMNFGPQTDEDRQSRSWTRRWTRHQLLRHGQRVRLGREQGPDRTDHRLLVRPGRRPPRRKVCSPPRSTATWATWPNEGKLSALNIRRAVDASLKRLQTDYIDLYQFHHVDRDAVGGDLAGHRGRWSAGQDPVRRQQQLRRLAHRPGPGGRGAAATSSAWSASSRSTTCSTGSVEIEVCRRRSTTASASFPGRRCTAGCWAGCSRRSEATARRLEGRAAEALEKHREQIQAYEDFADELGQDPADVALAWLLHPPGSPRRSSARARWSSSTRPSGREIELDADVLATLDEIFPGHGGSDLLGVGEPAGRDLRLQLSAFSPSQALRPRSVRTTVGLIVLAVTPRAAHSDARTLVRPTSPEFGGAVGGVGQQRDAGGLRGEVDHLAGAPSSMIRRHRHMWNAPVRLIGQVVFHAPAVRSSAGARMTTPAQLTRMSILPNLSCTCETARATDASSVTSHLIATLSPPICPVWARAASRARSRMATVAPWLRRRRWQRRFRSHRR